MPYFDTAILYLDALGITDVIIPFILLFTILYAVLRKTELFVGADKKKPVNKFNGIISFAIALIVIIPHVTGTYPSEQDPIVIINQFLPGAILISIALLIFLMLLGLVKSKGEAGVKEGTLATIGGTLAVIALILVFWRALFSSGAPDFLYFLDDPNLQSIIVIIIVMAIIISFVTQPQLTAAQQKEQSRMQWLKNFWGGGK